MPSSAGGQRAADTTASDHDDAYDHIDEEKCRSFQSAAELVGRKWTAGILLAGLRGARRFVEYRAHVAGISDRLLAQRLRELEEQRLVVRTVTPTTPVLVTYRPSERARGLMRAIHPLVAWSLEDQAHG
ncbi:helix-turn-helix transcriptional regulator [Pseudonocardia sp. KRD-184]|uniref:Helix-turn-helix transcriptional regulator n=1 Tax=Pseudonocardia oceani TaxID=2792013 RepID=A0ABS6U466_9PSEU|nr:helix-turn-helix domain-containing protein [Pseudonocardia oceani]MBW0092322.1 helix-turn-helix transcriptional regulator [Pseudonocardia oceani]MBW0097874.1 helix-turn-helix transcriptional regulator [Pseudonocardia oceani]MBW0124555.1 helix-turn-helix transcriptional regulator [Pseudonocardia oceani]MBW0127025.1 helix-turn-helix transcriptional regulator [Pseudonocardia oceani]